jgi:hypothetical protein
MNLRKTLILAVILAASAMYLSKVSIPKRESRAATQPVFRGLEPNDIGRIGIVLSGEGSAPYHLIQKMTGPAQGEPSSKNAASAAIWEVEELKNAPLDEQVVSELAKAVAALQITGPLSEKDQSADFSVYGLDKPVLTMTVVDKAGSQTELAFGKENAYLENRRYAKVSGRGGIYLMDAAAFSSLNKSSKEVRSRNPLVIQPSDVREVVVTTPRGKVKITQPAVGEWRIAEPKDLPASAEAMSSLVSALGELSVKEFLDGQQGDLGRFRLDKPDVAVEVSLRPGIEPVSRRVVASAGEGGKGGYFFYDGAPSVFSVDEESGFSGLTKGVDDLRENRLFMFGERDIYTLRAATSDGALPVEIATNETDWNVNGKLSDPVFVEEYLRDVVALRASGFPEPGAVPVDAFSKPFVALVITKKGDAKETVTVTVGKEVSGTSGPERYARIGEQGPVVLIRDVEAKRIVPHEEALVPLETPAPAVAQK